MAPYLESCAAQFGWPIDANELASIKDKNSETLKKMEEVIVDATENLGENDVIAALLKKADYLFQIGDKEATVKAYAAAKEKALSSTQGIDITFNIIRTGFFHLDRDLIKKHLEIASKLVDEGGDWDRRNRLKVFQATNAIVNNDLKKAASLFLEGVATFTCYEMFDYHTFVFYTALTGMLKLDRVTLKKKIINQPEIVTIVDEIPHIGSLINSYYNCQYRKFFEALVDIYPRLLTDRYTATFAQHIVREMRLCGYNQFLQSYKSCTLNTMATAFGISLNFLDTELSRFIGGGRLAAKIDKVDGVVQTNRQDSTNAQYQGVIKHGDALLNRVQKLARIVNV